jgi:hypothetical protein
MVKKSIISDINRDYISLIKELIIIGFLNEDDIKREFILGDFHIYGNKKTTFILIYDQSVKNKTINECFDIEGQYSIKGENNFITIKMAIHNRFDFEQFNFLYFTIKSVLYHEIEHHLQYNLAPFREKIQGSQFNYIYNEHELEAFLKEVVYLSKAFKCKKSKAIDFISNIFLGSTKISFKTSLIRYINKRKDLNIKYE